jgi:hypothetical protein
MATGVGGTERYYENFDFHARSFIASGVNVLGSDFTTGETFYVNSAVSNGDGFTPQTALSTIDAAIGKCTANQGDRIYVLPGHTENISAASFITADIAGVRIIGLGRGASLPTLTWTVEAATIVVSAASISFENFRFVNNFANITTMFSVTGAGDDLAFVNCLFTDTSTILNAIDFITLATGVDGLALVGCQVIGKSASNDSFITGVAHDRVLIDKCHIQFDVAQTSVVGLIETSGNATNVWIRDSAFRSNVDGALFLDFNGGANSGLVTNCYFSSIDDAGAISAGFDFTGGHFFECYVAGEADLFGIVGGGTGPYVNA